jgi:hypothetical protein
MNPKKCPWCQSEKIMAEGTDKRIAMVCQKCLARGPEVPVSMGREGALRAWNKHKTKFKPSRRSRIAIDELRQLAKRYQLTHAILFATDYRKVSHVVTFGRTVVACGEAADFGNKLKTAMGWPASLHSQPSRVRRLQAEIERLKAIVTANARSV